jgi:hypothetical protein
MFKVEPVCRILGAFRSEKGDGDLQSRRDVWKPMIDLARVAQHVPSLAEPSGVTVPGPAPDECVEGCFVSVPVCNSTLGKHFKAASGVRVAADLHREERRT